MEVNHRLHHQANHRLRAAKLFVAAVNRPAAAQPFHQMSATTGRQPPRQRLGPLRSTTLERALCLPSRGHSTPHYEHDPFGREIVCICT
jgi:hypothetical protein